MPRHYIRIGNVRSIYLYYWDSSTVPPTAGVQIVRQSGGNFEWFVRDKRVACLVRQPTDSVPPADVIRVIESALSLGRRAYLRSLAGPEYRAANP